MMKKKVACFASPTPLLFFFFFLSNSFGFRLGGGWGATVFGRPEPKFTQHQLPPPHRLSSTPNEISHVPEVQGWGSRGHVCPGPQDWPHWLVERLHGFIWRPGSFCHAGSPFIESDFQPLVGMETSILPSIHSILQDGCW